MKHILLNMLSVLSNHKHDKQFLMTMYVSERLDKSFDVYNKEIQHSLEFLNRKHEKSIIKRLNKLNDKLD